MVKYMRQNEITGYLNNHYGYTLVEVVVVMLIIGILAAVASNSLMESTETERFEETKHKMDLLAFAVAGNPALLSNGVRSDYGYIGDIGAFPISWDALINNPGGYITWDGPYIQDDFSTGSSSYFNLDGWGIQFSAPATYFFTSSGGSSLITRKIANSIDQLLYNRVKLSITDLDFNPPGSLFRDSVAIILIYPNGIGGTAFRSANPDAGGYIEFDSIPIGMHTLKIVFIPQNDTLSKLINIDPGQNYSTEIQYYADIW
jgi:prepilin-type N-terminal cleavage/methylation domain-containing protein